MLARIRICVADDHPIVLQGLRNLIEAAPDLELVGEARRGLEALKLIREQRPDVAVIDLSMPELGGIPLTRRVVAEAPGVRVLILTLHDDRAHINEALKAGARGYVLKRAIAENLADAIRAVHVGGLYLDPELLRMDGRGHPLATPAGGGIELTAREIEVLKLTALGYTNKEIARQIDVGVKSVETYKARAAEKLGLRSRAEIVRYAAGQGWLSEI